MSGYRFCRTDDIGLLAEALNRCWAPSFPDEPPMTPAAFKRSIRDVQVWCSSCMVAFAGADPIGVLIGAKRPFATLVHRIAVHPDYQRQGHGQHLLTSLASKLAILGPQRIVSEVPEGNVAARALFGACGYVKEAMLTDYVWEAARLDRVPTERNRLTIPITVDDLNANGLLGPEYPPACWERSVETVMARKDEIEGLAVASDERIEACILYIKDAAQILSLRSFVEDDGTRLVTLLSRLPANGMTTASFAKVHPAEIPVESLGGLGFRPADAHLLYADSAQNH